jgi:peptidoglycan hydrolase-like protein with peptidoglycan-binding domain/3D (Asp-Asp-Asp) domain-containing protein
MQATLIDKSGVLSYNVRIYFNKEPMRKINLKPIALSKTIAATLALLQLLSFVPGAKADVAMEGAHKMLMVSAYYSPLPAQRFYMRGSYEADLRLNGYGIHGADRTPVQIGMLAAPKSYAFGTEVRIPGLGIGEVHDRGGAIYSNRSYDRIDVWMGSGEEGLARALNWGMRLVEGEVLEPDSVEPQFDFSWVSSELPKDTLNRLMARTMLNPEVFAKPITRTSPTADISDLQEALRMFGYYHGAVTGTYDADTRQAVMVFQIAEGVLISEQSMGAGNLGQKTLKTLKTKIENFNSTVLKEQNRLRENLSALSVGLGKKDEGDKVYRMQQMMWELGYYKGELNGKYDSSTTTAVFDFQKANGIVQSDWQQGAGFYGKKTHEALVAAIDQKIEKLMKYPAEMQVWVPSEVDLPKLGNLTLGNSDLPHSDLGFDLKIVAAKSSLSIAKTLEKDLALGDKGADVQELQKVLIQQKLLPRGSDSGTFGEKTQKALIQLQLKKGLIQNTQQLGAGVVGPKTRKLLNSLL